MSEIAVGGRQVSLCEVLDRILDQGVVAAGDVTLSLAGVDLVYVNLRLLLASAASVMDAEGTNELRQRTHEAGTRPSRDAA